MVGHATSARLNHNQHGTVVTARFTAICLSNELSGNVWNVKRALKFDGHLNSSSSTAVFTWSRRWQRLYFYGVVKSCVWRCFIGAAVCLEPCKHSNADTLAAVANQWTHAWQDSIYTVYVLYLLLEGLPKARKLHCDRRRLTRGRTPALFALK